jgi:plasmid stabilization system protein ParE
MLPLRVRPEAELDALDAASWYDGGRAGLGTEFIDELRTTFGRIEDGPERFPRVFQECRRAIVHRFPFGVFFVVETEFAAVVAITHLRRDPSVWQNRL